MSDIMECPRGVECGIVGGREGEGEEGQSRDQEREERELGFCITPNLSYINGLELELTLKVTSPTLHS